MTLISDPQKFIYQLEHGSFPSDGSAVAKAVMMVEPADFNVCEESSIDNRYMNLTSPADSGRALQQSRDLGTLISAQGIEVHAFPGDPQTPDAVFPNNVFATTTSGKFIIGHMLHPGRQKEATRQDIRDYFNSKAYQTIDLSQRDCIAELTGPLIIDHARRIGFCGMTGRVDQAGLEAMHDAFDLRMIFHFQLQPGEYHTNVVMMVLAGRACVLCADAFASAEVPRAIGQAFPGRTLLINVAEKDAFAGNCIALTENDLFMSTTGVAALRPQSREKLTSWGFKLHDTALDEIEKAGGSLRCMIAEIF